MPLHIKSSTSSAKWYLNKHKARQIYLESAYLNERTFGYFLRETTEFGSQGCENYTLGIGSIFDEKIGT